MKEKWEYLVLSGIGYISQEDLNVCGREGWEIISVTCNQSNSVMAFFKRKLPTILN